LAVSTKFHRGSTISLTALQASAQEINLKTLLGDTTTQQLQDLKIQARGKVPFSDYQHSSLKGSFSAKNMREQVYHLDALQGALSLDNDKATIQVEPVEKGQHVVGRVTLGKIWTENPSVGVSVQGSGINPAIWMRNKEYTGSVNFSANLSGEGWYPRQKMWNYQLTIHNSSLMGQSLEKATLNGKFSQNSIINQSDIAIASGRLHLNAEAHDIQSLPVFSYSLQARSINLAGLKGLSSYPSVINGSIQGKGRGNSLQNLQLTTTAAIDSSVFKKEPFQKLKFTMNVADSVITISDAVMQSAIADGTLSGRVHLGHWYDANNKLNFQAKIKDLSPFAPMAGVKILRAKGTMNGQIEPAGSDSLVFDSNLQLHGINYGNEFTAQKMNGKARVSLEKNPRYSVDITIAKPTISSANLESINLKTRGRVAGAETSGSYKIDLAGAGKNRISQGGSYRMSGDTTAAEISKFTLTGNKRTLALAKPFHIKMINSTVRTDTMRLSSKDGTTYIALAVPYADSLRQKGYVKAQQIQLAPIQNALFNEKYVEGAVFGDVHFDHSADDMTASGNIVLSDLSYAGAKLDSLRLQATIKNKQLQGKLTARKNGKEILEGQANIPFSMQRPGKLKSDFSRQPVEGHLTVQPIALSEFQTWMKKAGISGTKGTFQFHGTLSGEVSNPSFNANLSLKNANLSGVPIDSLTASAHYQNEQSMLNFKAAVTSLHHQALNIDGKFPFKINLQNFSMSMPGPNSKLALQVGANKFDLKTLDGFLNRKMARNLQGRIDGHVDISGPRDNLSTNGQLTLQEGAIRLVTAGIRIDHIQSTFQFQPDKIVFSKLDMRSGKGSLHARGQLGLKNLTAQNLDVSIKAQNFKAANTKNYNAVVDANLNMSGKLTSPKITGNLNVMDGFVKLNNFGQKSVENVQLDTTMTPETQTSLYDSLSLNMNISLNRRFYVRNSRYLKMEIGLNGKLSLQKNPGKDMQIFGTLNTVNGYAEPLGKHFNIQKGTIAFSGPPSNPELDIRTLYEPPQTNQSVKIWYIIQGTVKDPKFEYNSDPPMDLSSILSYTLFGQPIYSLNPAAQSVAGSAGGGNVATNFAMQLLMNRLESLANQKLGIDVVKIENVQVGGKSGTSVTTGWYINPKVFFAIQNVITGSTPSPGFYLEYYIKKNLKLILSQGTNNRDGVGADLEWKHDY
ncbi:MAG TPA: translocation/assembly module TamB domain-containing protein, partial [Balneolaceae bacterium]|nr:translocation/assembly module TamB domain-containing protein [Balneolaceae bacterium]